MGSDWCSSRRTIIAIVVAVVLVALGLGLGLGLGLSKNDSSTDDSVKTDGCFTQVQSRKVPKSKTAAQWSCNGQLQCPNGRTTPVLIVLSMDGFRADYLLRNMTPNLKKLSDCGVHSPYMRAMFPTKTFPNHYTIATGLYAESHGIIDNFFYDPDYKETFSMGGRNLSDNRWWWGEPIWNTAKKAGKRVATFFWPGSDVNIQEIGSTLIPAVLTSEHFCGYIFNEGPYMRPDICYNYNQSIPLEDRVNEILSWYKNPDMSTHPDLVMMYFEQPDSAGHNQGPFGDWVKGNLTYVDGLIGDLIQGMELNGYGNCVNFVAVADHGMEGIDCKRVVDISKYVDPDKYYIYTGISARMTSQYLLNRTSNQIYTNPNPVPVDETLSQVACINYNNTKDWYIQFFKKENLPKRYHYGNNRRIDEIVMDVKDEYSLLQLKYSTCSIFGGGHGYDNTYKSMHAIFLGAGPSFKSGLVVDPFENIELYGMFAELLGIAPAPNNGTPGSLHGVLRGSQQELKKPRIELKKIEECPFPDDILEREKRRNESECIPDALHCSLLNGTTVDSLDLRLNLTSGQISDALSNHLPFGTPSSQDDTGTVCRLVQADYVTGYNNEYHLPAWTSFTLSHPKGSPSTVLNETWLTDNELSSCVRSDVRLSDQINCLKYRNDLMEITSSFLFPPGLISAAERESDAYVSSNLVPMFTNFRSGVWKETLHLLEEYAEKYQKINVVLGAIFDYNANGLADSFSEIKMFADGGRTIPVPSHYFVIASICTDVSPNAKCTNFTQVLSLILDHEKTDLNCWSSRSFEHLRENVARVRDIELLTGLTFFTDLETSLRIKTETYLPEHLWSRISWMDTDDQCPDLSQGAQCPPHYNSDKPPLILISLDGFRPDYMEKQLTPTLARLHKCGVTTPYMSSIYPTLTFPNHNSIVTGVYPESHGIIDNSMYDTTLNESFYLGSSSSMKPEWWNDGEPIWVYLENNNKVAMTFFWPGSDVEIRGVRPTVYMPYDGSVPYSRRVATALQWLNGSAGPYPDLEVLYFSKVDEAGHEGGPGSYQVDEALEAVDNALLQLMDGIYRLGLEKCVNIIIVSDHGMSDISCDRSVLMKDYLSSEIMNKTYVYAGAAGRISNKYTRTGNNYNPVPVGQQVGIENITNSLRCRANNLVAYDKKDLPRHFHYVNHRRIDDVLLVLADTWLTDSYTPWCPIKGQHGWDQRYDSMKAFFMAYGPGFKRETTFNETFENIELYNIMAYLTGVTAAPNNGTEGSLYHLLQSPPSLPSLSSTSVYTSCDYPGTDDDYEQRANLTTMGCDCSGWNNEDLRRQNDRLNFSSDAKNTLDSRHISHGHPSLQHNDTTCILYHDEFISGYNHRTKLPSWTAFRQTPSQTFLNLTTECLRPDVRLLQDEQFSCRDFNGLDSRFSPVSFFPSAWSSKVESVNDTALLSNLVPMYNNFKTGVWFRLLEIIGSESKNSAIDVVFGPIFDYNADGIRDDNITVFSGGIPIPSHYFAIVLRCLEPNNCANMLYDPIAFVLPHEEHLSEANCQTPEQFLLLNIARIRDVELLTGLQFLTANNTQEAIRTRVKTPLKSWLTRR